MELKLLVKRAQQGDQQAVAAICLRFAGLVKKYAFQPHIRSIAEEAQSQGWLAVVQAIRQYDEGWGVQFPAYVESQIKYAVWNLFKRERRRWQQVTPLEGWENEGGLSMLEWLPDATNVAKEVEARLLCQEIKEAIALLSDKQRRVIEATVLGEEGLTGMAVVLGMTPQGVYNLRQRGLARLKVLCAGMYEDVRHS